MSLTQQFLSLTNKRTGIILLHILGITFFVGQEVLLMHALGMPPTIKGYIAFALEIGIFYANLLWVVPCAFAHKQAINFIARLMLVVVTYFLCRSWLAYNTSFQSGFINFAIAGANLLFTLWRLNYLLGFGFLLGFYKAVNKHRQQQQHMELELAHAKAEKARIESVTAQMQLSPHLLLSGLYYLQINVTDSSPSVSGAIRVLADIVRYSLIDVRATFKVPLHSEIEQVKNRISYQQYIYDDLLHIQLSVSNDTKAALIVIPPFILITLADNVLKYGWLTDADHPATIHIKQVDSQLEFLTWNSKIGTVPKGQGMGLAHVKQVLDYHYPGNYVLTINDTESEYALSLTINT